MTLLLETLVNHGFILDVFGVIGIGLIGLAAVRLAKHHGSPHATLMTWGALALIAGRIGILVYTGIVNPQNVDQFDPLLLALGRNIPIGLLTAGLGAMVFGFWSHERHTAGEAV